MQESDPIEELHKIRKSICLEAGGTPAAYARYYFEMSKKRIRAGAAAGKCHRKPANRRRRASSE